MERPIRMANPRKIVIPILSLSSRESVFLDKNPAMVQSPIKKTMPIIIIPISFIKVNVSIYSPLMGNIFIYE